MTTVTFDALGYFEKLKAAGFTEEQAKTQAAALQKALDKYDEASRKDLATKGDIQDVRLEMKSMEMRLLKWQLGIAAALGSFTLAGFGTLAVVMAKGFGWLGF